VPANPVAEEAARRVLRFPLVVEAQADSALDVDSVVEWRRAATAVFARHREPAPDAPPTKMACSR
jgi:hypothetical protein